MASDNKTRRLSRIPIRFLDSEGSNSASQDEDDSSEGQIETSYEMEEEINPTEATNGEDEFSDEVVQNPSGSLEGGGPAVAELVATRAELKRVEGEVAELKDRLARRQADFENYRKRNERERSETHNRIVADVASKLLPVLDNLGRALAAEETVESSESDEFRHFLSGVDLIYKQLEGVIDALGVKPISAVGEPFNPHLHEAVVTEESDEFPPDTVMQEIVRGYRMGDKLIRPSMVKVAVKK
jgi:molecular chaperone GrpE